MPTNSGDGVGSTSRQLTSGGGGAPRWSEKKRAMEAGTCAAAETARVSEAEADAACVAEAEAACVAEAEAARGISRRAGCAQAEAALGIHEAGPASSAGSPG